MVLIVDKFKGWRTDELQYVASLIAGRECFYCEDTRNENHELYQELIREIRNRRIKEELFQMKLE
jgi:hypothetical protein